MENIWQKINELAAKYSDYTGGNLSRLVRIKSLTAHEKDVQMELKRQMEEAGFDEVFIGETITDNAERPALPSKPIDPPTIKMEFAVNDGPLAGQDGRLVTARHIWERLVKEVRTNVAIKVAQTADPKVFAVSGRGEMQIAILVEQMRREGHEVLVSRPEVLWRQGPQGGVGSWVSATTAMRRNSR